MRYTPKQVLEILIERLSRDISTVESQIKQQQVENPATLPALTAVQKSLLDTREITTKSLAGLPPDPA
jgi:hypothetical protein